VHRGASKTQGLVFGGLMAALVVLFAVVPLLTLFLPIPLVLAYVRYGGRAAGLTAVVGLIFTAMFTGPIMAFLMIPTGVMGLVFGYGIRYQRRPLVIGLVAVAVFFAGYVGQYVVTRSLLLGGQDPFVMALESEQGQRLLNASLGWMESLAEVPADPTPSQVQMAEITTTWVAEFRQDPVAITWMLLPFSIFMTGMWVVWVSYVLCGVILRRFGHTVPPLTPFAEWRLPVWLTPIFAVLFVLFGMYASGPLLGAPWWVQLLLNIVPPLQMIFVVVGIAVAYGFLRQRDVPKHFAVAFVIAGFFLGPIGIQLYLVLAMVDSVFDFRSLGHGLLRRPQENQ
jgi:uncharacterized protein YybS (DUF2232 family)